MCLECENPVHSYEGHRVVRGYSYPVRTIARTLGRVADGKPYTAASATVSYSRRGERGMLAADWVEAYAADL